jgi:hypothetical protein
LQTPLQVSAMLSILGRITLRRNNCSGGL